MHPESDSSKSNKKSWDFLEFYSGIAWIDVNNGLHTDIDYLDKNSIWSFSQRNILMGTRHITFRPKQPPSRLFYVLSAVEQLAFLKSTIYAP